MRHAELFIAFTFLDAQSLGRAVCVNKEWKEHAEIDYFWEALARRRWKTKARVGVDFDRMRELLGDMPQPGQEPHRSFWRHAFLFAEEDSQRTRISARQLCTTSWAFSDGLQHARFHPDGSLHMELYPPLRWRFDPSHAVLIENFPQHHTWRREDWGWVISNPLVAFESEDGGEFESPVPLPVDATYADVVLRLEEVRALKEKKRQQWRRRQEDEEPGPTPHQLDRHPRQPQPKRRLEAQTQRMSTDDRRASLSPPPSPPPADVPPQTSLAALSDKPGHHPKTTLATNATYKF